MASENFTAILRLVAFGTLITATSRATRGCGSISDVQPREVPLQPPDWVFGIVWPGLYLTTGIAWAMSGPDVDLPLGAATMLSCSWLVVYTCLRAPDASGMRSPVHRLQLTRRHAVQPEQGRTAAAGAPHSLDRLCHLPELVVRST